jgi:anthranilate phosphoribosyltransferase
MALGMPREEMLARMSSAELTEWMAFAQLEPFGSEADLIGHAITASTVANRHRNKGEKAHEIKEFIPTFRKKKQSIDEMMQIAEMMTIGLGGKDLKEVHDEG